MDERNLEGTGYNGRCTDGDVGGGKAMTRDAGLALQWYASATSNNGKFHSCERRRRRWPLCFNRFILALKTTAYMVSYVACACPHIYDIVAHVTVMTSINPQSYCMIEVSREAYYKP